MSVVLRGIDKPSDCDYCPFQSDSYCSLLLSYIIVEHGVDPRCLISEISGYTLKNGHRVVISVDDEGRERHEIHLDRKTEPTISKMEQVDELQTEELPPYLIRDWEGYLDDFEVEDEPQTERSGDE